MFIISLTYKADISLIEAQLEAHKRYLQEQYDTQQMGGT